jgi:hypothetical protein
VNALFGATLNSHRASIGLPPYWAARVVGLGIGTAHDGLTSTIESLSAAL